MSTPVATTRSAKSIASLSETYGLSGKQVNGNNVMEVFEAAKEAINGIRKNNKSAFLLECMTYRQEGHFYGDPCLYRDKEEVLYWKKEKDPISFLRNYFIIRAIFSC